jgi:hypothetical protein
MNESDYTKMIPIEVVKEMLNTMSVDNINSLCSTDKYIQIICRDEKFWREYIINNHQLEGNELLLWELNVNHQNITWHELASLYENGRPLIILNEDTDERKVIQIVPETKLSEIFELIKEKIIDTRRYVVHLRHPFKVNDDYAVEYNGNKILVYINDYNNWIAYNDKPIGKNKLYDLIYQISGV